MILLFFSRFFAVFAFLPQKCKKRKKTKKLIDCYNFFGFLHFWMQIYKKAKTMIDCYNFFAFLRLLHFCISQKSKNAKKQKT